MKRILSIACFVVFGIGSADAQVFTSQSAFETALNPGFYSNSFAGLPDGTNIFSGGTPTISFNIDSPGGLYWGPTLTGTSFSGDSFTFTITGGNPNAIGAHFYTTDITDTFVPGVQMTLTYSDGFVDTYTPATVGQFRGYASTVPLTSVIVTADNLDTYVSIDTVRLGFVPVPEPITTCMAFVVGFGGFSILRRRFSPRR